MAVSWLVIGGTGMLAGVSLALCAGGEDVWLISREASRVAPLRAKAGDSADRLHFVAADYTEERALAGALRKAAQGEAPRHVLAWMADGPWWNVLFSTLREVAKGRKWELFRVRGSAAALEEPPSVPSDVTLHLIILGFTVEDGQSRWLSHQEIADGVLAALREPQPRTVVGMVHPWSLRPPY